MADRTHELAAEWLDWLRTTKGRSPNTLIAYRRVVGSYAAITPDLERATPEHIERWLQRPRDGRSQGETASPATQNRDASCIRSFYGYLNARGHISRDPSALVCTPTVRNVQPRPLPDETWQKLWHAVDGDGEAIALGLGFFCGLRREELTRLRVSHVDLGGRRLVNFVRKGGGEDILPMGTMLSVYEKRLGHLDPERLWPLVEGQCERRDGNEWLIGWSDLGRRAASDGQLEPRHVNAWLDRLSRRAGIPHVHPHQLRHSCATNLLRSGVPLPIVSNLLNHANVHTTMRYVRAGSDELGEWLRDRIL